MCKKNLEPMRKQGHGWVQFYVLFVISSKLVVSFHVPPSTHDMQGVSTELPVAGRSGSQRLGRRGTSKSRKTGESSQPDAGDRIGEISFRFPFLSHHDKRHASRLPCEQSAPSVQFVCLFEFPVSSLSLPPQPSHPTLLTDAPQPNGDKCICSGAL
jgi:hypothetical protein